MEKGWEIFGGPWAASAQPPSSAESRPLQPMRSAIAASLKKQQALGPQPSSRLFWKSDECDKKPESEQPPSPLAPVSAKEFGEKTRASGRGVDLGSEV